MIKKLVYLIIPIVAIITGIIAFQFSYNKSNSSIVDINKSEYNNVKQTIVSSLDELVGSNKMIITSDSDGSKTVTIYNDKKEAISQSLSNGYISVYMGDMAFSYADYVVYAKNSSIVSLLNAFKGMIDSDKYKLYLDKTEESTYVFDVMGWDGISELYSSIDESLGEIMVEQLKRSLGYELYGDKQSETDAGMHGSKEDFNSFDNATIDYDKLPLNLRFKIKMEDGDVKQIACYTYIAYSNNIKIDDNTVSLNWKTEEIKDIDQWGLDKRWYEYDFSNLEEWDMETMEKCEELVVDTINYIGNLINQ